MQTFKNFYQKGNVLHHAYCIEGDLVSAKKALVDFLDKKIGFNILRNPDFFLNEFETFLVEDSRNIASRQSMSPLSGDKKVFVITFNSITNDAQNALLKVFEEPAPHTHFFILTPNAENFLPTFKSRLVILKHAGEETEKVFSAEEFVKATPKKRLEMLAGIIKEKDRARARVFIGQLEKFFASDISKLNTEQRDFVKMLIEYRKSLLLSGASIKLLLENISLICPKF